MKTSLILYKNALNSKYTAHEISLMFRELASKHCDIPMQQLYFLEDIVCAEDKKLLLQKDLERLSAGEPFQYVLGYTEFCGLKLNVDENVLIPRQETSELIEWIAKSEKNVGKILDVGTGSGCIAMALKQKHPEWDIWGIDVQEECIAIARQNSQNLNLDVEWKVGNVLSADILNILPDEVDIIVSNPPYVRNCEKQDMSVNVLDHEPHLALFVPDTNPLIFYNNIARLYKSTHIFFEINEYLWNETSLLLTSLGYTDIQIKKDMFAKNRMIYGYLQK